MPTTSADDTLLNRIHSQEEVRIPLPDGTELAARIWLPRNAEKDPVPAIMEYIPYRLRDMTRSRDTVMHPYFAAQGYAAVRVDMRGSGDSDGILPDEYTQQEMQDGCDAIRWLAEQPWCNGNIGMIGISWGGFNGLQIASLQPPELKAVVAVCATDDRYADDVHYMGGCLLGDNLSWAATMFAFNSLPPDPATIGSRWRTEWLKRLAACEPWVIEWLRHPHRTDYWRHGSVCEDWGKIQCPVMAVSGWADGYSNAVFRLMKHLQVPRQGLIGPWSHKYPHEGVPGPAIGFLQEVVRWWDYWLKDRENGIMQAPMLRAWQQDSVAPYTQYAERPGHWVGELSWPSPRVKALTFGLDGLGRLLPEAEQVDATPLGVQSFLSLGLFAGKWCSYAATPDLPSDQREEDGGALVFETRPLEQPLALLGAPSVLLSFSVDRPVAMVALRLSDVATNDKATRMTYGILNLCHRTGHDQPTPLEPGKRYQVRVWLNGFAHTLPSHHRVRLSISTSYWPLAWASPEMARLTVYPDQSSLELPEHFDDGSLPVPGFLPPEGAPPLVQRQLTPSHHNWWVKRDLEKNVSILEVINDSGWFHIEETGLDVKRDTREWYTSQGDELSSLTGEVNSEWGLRRGDWCIETTTYTKMTCTPDHFHVHARLDAFENGDRVYSRNWDEDIPRQLV